MPAQPTRLRRFCTPRRAYTLVEMLIVVAILGLAAAIVIPTMASATYLRMQGSLRTLVSDLSIAQSDAIAFQRRRAVVFNARVTTNSGAVNDPGVYQIREVTPSGVDPGGLIVERNIGVAQFGDAEFLTASFTVPGSGQALAAPNLWRDSTNGTFVLTFDELGTPIVSPTDTTPAPSQRFFFAGPLNTGTTPALEPDQWWELTVEAFTGRITITNWTP